MVDPVTRRYMLMMKSDIESLDMDCLDISPEIYYGNGRAYVSCCYWSDFGGLEREYAELTLKDGRMEVCFFIEKKALFKYECGIVF